MQNLPPVAEVEAIEEGQMLTLLRPA